MGQEKPRNTGKHHLFWIPKDIFYEALDTDPTDPYYSDP